MLPVELYNQLVDPERFKNYGQCENYPVFGDPFPVCRPSSMALLKEAQRIAEQFSYSDENVNQGVREFIRQMDEGLEKQGTTMSQIPSYVTAVPNGTEKVAATFRYRNNCLTDFDRAHIWLLTSVAQIFESAQSSCMGIKAFLSLNRRLQYLEISW